MAGLARSIDLARGNAGKANFRPLGAPDRTVTVPHRDRRAGERDARGDDLSGKDQHHAGSFPAIALSMRSRRSLISFRSLLAIAWASEDEVIRNS